MNRNTITFINVQSALVSAVIASLIAMGFLVVQSNDVYNLDWRAISNIGAITMIASLLKALGTVPAPYGTVPMGTFAGVQVR